MAQLVVYIRSRDFFGSQIISYPLLYQLYRMYPNQSIRVVGQDNLAHYYCPLPWVETYARCNGLPQNARQIEADTHTVISLHPTSEKVALLGLIKRVPVRVGFRNGRALDFSWTHSYRYSDQEYIGLANCRLLAQLADFDPLQAARNSMLGLARSGSTAPVALSRVVLMPGGGAGAFKRWPIASFWMLIQQLDTLLGTDTTYTVVLGQAEAREMHFLQERTHPRIQLLISRPLHEIAAVCTQAQLVVANDCGPSHIGQMAGAAYVGVFPGPNPRWFWSRRGARLVVPVNSSDGINSITPAQVLAACRSALDESQVENAVTPGLVPSSTVSPA